MKVLELFAGVGGFRIGLENADKDLFKTLWSNQYEPSRKSQDAFEVYNYHFPDSEISLLTWFKENCTNFSNRTSIYLFRRRDVTL